MHIVDSIPGHRAICLKPTEKLTSQRLTAALIQYGGYSRAQATETIAQVYDALGSQLWDAQNGATVKRQMEEAAALKA